VFFSSDLYRLYGVTISATKNVILLIPFLTSLKHKAKNVRQEVLLKAEKKFKGLKKEFALDQPVKKVNCSHNLYQKLFSENLGISRSHASHWKI
jgi:hypothetical protein